MSKSVGSVIVGGGSGFIGSHLCRVLRNNNYDTTIISRMPGPKRITWQEIQANGLPPETTAVINVAGQNVLDPMRRWTPGFKQNVWNSRVKTTETLAQAIIQAKVKPSAFITISGVGIYKPSINATYTEESKEEEFDFFSKLCIEWEKAARLPDAMGCRQITVRSGVVLGKDGGMIKQIYWPFFFGLGGPIGSGEQYFPWIHIDDIAGLMTFAIKTPLVKGIVNGVSPHTITNKEFTDAFASALSRPAIIPLPVGILNLVFHQERAKMMTEGQKVLPKRAQALGYNFEYPNIISACEQLVNT